LICSAHAARVGGDEHLTSTWGTNRKYIDWTRVGAARIVVRTQEFVHPVFRRQFEPFEPNLVVLNLLFSQGSSAMTTSTRSSRFPAVVG
jgi:hypothetical protein